MYNGIGLQTPRGSGTNGYVQRNLSHYRPVRNDVTKNIKSYIQKPVLPKYHLEGEGEKGDGREGTRKDVDEGSTIKVRKADREILLHEKKREGELQLRKLRKDLEERKRLNQKDIDRIIDRKRAEMMAKIEKDFERSMGSESGGGIPQEKNNASFWSKGIKADAFGSRDGFRPSFEQAKKMTGYELQYLKEKQLQGIEAAIAIDKGKHQVGRAFDIEFQNSIREQEKAEKQQQWEERKKRMIQEKIEALKALSGKNKGAEDSSDSSSDSSSEDEKERRKKKKSHKRKKRRSPSTTSDDSSSSSDSDSSDDASSSDDERARRRKSKKKHRMKKERKDDRNSTSRGDKKTSRSKAKAEVKNEHDQSEVSRSEKEGSKRRHSPEEVKKEHDAMRMDERRTSEKGKDDETVSRKRHHPPSTSPSNDRHGSKRFRSERYSPQRVRKDYDRDSRPSETPKVPMSLREMREKKPTVVESKR